MSTSLPELGATIENALVKLYSGRINLFKLNKRSSRHVMVVCLLTTSFLLISSMFGVTVRVKYRRGPQNVRLSQDYIIRQNRQGEPINEVAYSRQKENVEGDGQSELENINSQDESEVEQEEGVSNSKGTSDDDPQDNDMSNEMFVSNEERLHSAKSSDSRYRKDTYSQRSLNVAPTIHRSDDNSLVSTGNEDNEDNGLSNVVYKTLQKEIEHTRTLAEENKLLKAQVLAQQKAIQNMQLLAQQMRSQNAQIAAQQEQLRNSLSLAGRKDLKKISSIGQDIETDKFKNLVQEIAQLLKQQKSSSNVISLATRKPKSEEKDIKYSDNAENKKKNVNEEETRDIPEKEATDVPEKEATDVPEKAATDIPEKEATDIPEKEATDLPEKEVTDIPEKEVTDVPEKETPDVPSSSSKKKVRRKLDKTEYTDDVKDSTEDTEKEEVFTRPKQKRRARLIEINTRTKTLAASNPKKLKKRTKVAVIKTEEGQNEENVVVYDQKQKDRRSSKRMNNVVKTVLLFTKLFGQSRWSELSDKQILDYPQRAKCPHADKCKLTYDKDAIDYADAVVFHGVDLLNDEAYRLPNLQPSIDRRPLHQRWVFFMHESPENHQAGKDYQYLFNWTMTYEHRSDIFLPYNHYHALTQREARQVKVKNYAKGKEKLAIWMVSNCGKFRESYVQALLKWIDVSIYGECASNFGLSPGPCRRGSTECKRTINKHKFYFAFENSFCRDYVSEKFWNTLTNFNVVPVVFGANYDPAVVPPGSFVDTANFPSIKALAEYLLYLDRNNTAYNEYFRWRQKYRISGYDKICKLCEMVHTPNLPAKVYKDVWSVKRSCKEYEPKKLKYKRMIEKDEEEDD